MEDDATGTATIVGAPAPTLTTDGTCLTGTLDAIGSGPDGLPPAGVAKVREDALALLSTIVARYSEVVAEGEVGASGTARASTAKGGACTGLLYGRIQSGKTVAMISLVAAAMDNGFRVVVVLTSDNVTLVSQTAERFKALDGPIIHDARDPSSWQDDHAHIKGKIAKYGVVFVCSKNKKRLESLIEFLGDIDAPSYPALILDDEADQATLDANLAKRANAQKKGKGDVDPTAIFARVESLRATLRHNVFLQVTATPYALLLQSIGTTLRPSFTRLLEPGQGYTGGEAFFEAHHIDGPEPPVVFVDPDESSTLQESPTDPPEGLRRAIAFFLVSAGAQALLDPSAGRASQNFLCHTSQLRIQHKVLDALVREYVNRIDAELEAKRGESVDRLHQAYLDLGRTLPNAPSVEAVLEQVSKRLVRRKVIVVNAESDAAIGSDLNFIIGGNILGRGVTVKNLLVTYYMREPKVGQMDTMLQHARMYGYRSALMPFTRVFLPFQLALRFHEIHCIEGRLRRQLASADMNRGIPVERIASLQPTRRGVLDPDYLDSYAGGDHVYPKLMKEMSYEAFEKFGQRIARLCGKGTLPEHGENGVEEISFEALFELIEHIAYDGVVGWVPQAILGVLERQRQRLSGRAYLHSRRINRSKPSIGTGVLAGNALKNMKAKDLPVFCAFRMESDSKRYWYPSMIFERNMPDMMVNVNSDAG